MAGAGVPVPGLQAGEKIVMKTENIERCMKSKILDIQIELTNYHDPSDGSTSMGATVKDAYTGQVLMSLTWYYDFEHLMTDLNQKMAALKALT